MRAPHRFFLFFTLCLVTNVGYGQELPTLPEEKNTNASRYFLGKEHELLMPVNILGPVNKPGQYMLPSETDLISLVAYAGGFKVEANTNDIRIVRKMGNHEQQPQIIRISLAKYYTTGDQTLTPLLMPDDTIIIGHRAFVPMKTVAEIARTLAYIAQIVYIYVLIEKP